jgi:hypothetical protein
MKLFFAGATYPHISANPAYPVVRVGKEEDRCVQLYNVKVNKCYLLLKPRTTKLN